MQRLLIRVGPESRTLFIRSRLNDRDDLLRVDATLDSGDVTSAGRYYHSHLLRFYYLVALESDHAGQCVASMGH